MLDIFTPHIQLLRKQITNSLAKKQKNYAEVNPWGQDVSERFSQFATQGKLIRGSLVCFSQELFGGKVDANAVSAGAALEILHSSLLIHDDIMDNDVLRRGQPSIHKQYEQLVSNVHKKNAAHIGISLGISAGDFGYFLAWEMLGQIKHPQQQKIMQKIAHEVGLVTIAQMQDVSSHGGKVLDQASILGMYQYKTGRYSFSLPLAVGALLANQPAQVIKRLERFGEAVGILFQLADDRLGIFGTPEQTGKSVGSDIKENKQTIYRALLFHHASPSEKATLQKLFGSSNITSKNLQFIHSMITKYAIDGEIEQLCKSYAEEAQSIIGTLPIAEKHKATISALVQYIQTRNK
jgi:geranylgeranyl diphosphate synthase, type I